MPPYSMSEDDPQPDPGQPGAGAGANSPPIVAHPIADQYAGDTQAFAFTVPDGTFSDPDGDPLSYTAMLASGDLLPQWLSFDPATRSFVGTPPAGEAATYAVSVTASDGGASTSTAFNIAVGDPHVQAGEDMPAVFAPYAGSDVAATVTVNVTGTIGLVSALEDGRVVYDPNGAFEGLARGAIGHDSFSVTTTADGVSTTQTYQVDIAGANDAPFATTTIDDQYAATGHAWSYTVPADLFSDVDGDALTYVAYSNVTEPLPDWLQFDPATRTFSGTPPAGFTGTLDLKVQANDGELTGGTRFDLTVTSGPVVDHPLVSQTVLEDHYFSFTVPADTFRDVSGDPLTYTATSGNGSPLPDWLHFDPATLTVAGQPPADYAGVFNVLVSASDGVSSASSKFALTVQNVPDAPTALTLVTPWVPELSKPGTVVGSLVTTDADVGDRFTFTLLDSDKGLFALQGDKLVVNGPLDSHVAGGLQNVTVRSTDSTGNSIDRTFAVHVQSGDQELFANAAPNRTIWVATNGSDATGDGSADHPFSTIQNAINLATPGTAVMVRAGTYAEALTIKAQGTADAPIWLESADGIGAAEIKPPAGAEINAINGQAIQNFVLEGFRITGTNTIGTYGLNIVPKNNGATASFQDGYAGTLNNNLLIKNNIITNWGIDDVHIAYSFNTQIVNNTISGAHEQGIDIVSGERLVIADNSVTNITKMPAWYNLDQRDYVGDSAITVKDGSLDVQILNNMIGNTAGYGIKVGAPSGLRGVPIEAGLDGDGGHYVSYEAKDVLVRGNTVLNSSGGAIDVNAGQHVTIEQNLITSIRMGGYERTINDTTYGGAERYIPGGIDAVSDDVTIRDNVYKGATLHNQPPGVNYTDTDNVQYDPYATYDPAHYAFAQGTSADWTSASTRIAGTTGDDVLQGDAHGSASNDYFLSRGGHDTITGGAGDDVYVLTGSDAHVVEAAGGGTDSIVLAGGTLFTMPEPTEDAGGYVENIYVANLPRDVVNGNSLDNLMVGGSGLDALRGAEGDDRLYGNDGNDTLNGGAGHDELHGGAGVDLLYGGIDDDVLEGGAGLDRLQGGAGNDTLISYDADTKLDGGVGVDLAYIDRSTYTAQQSVTLDVSYFGHGEGLANDPRIETLPDGTKLVNIEQIQIVTGLGADHVVGGFYDDQVSTGAGDDYINGYAGNDQLWGAAGTDEIHGGDGNDAIDGGTGSDFLYGDAGDDQITSYEADLVLAGGDGVDTLTLDRGNSTVAWSIDLTKIENDPAASLTLADGTKISGFEILNFAGGDGDDFIIGGARNDVLQGAHGSDQLFGGGGSDRLAGGSESDYLYGGTGGDILAGGGGADYMWGGAGTDTFSFVPGQAQGDVIYDFEGAGKAGGDKLSFTGYGPGATLTYDSTNQVWTAASADGSLHDSFTIVGVTSLIASDFSLL